jgi:hypothetical protein
LAGNILLAGRDQHLMTTTHQQPNHVLEEVNVRGVRDVE